MSADTPRGGCWPTEEQVLLLRAALLSGPDAVDAWHRWRSQVNRSRLDEGSARLLPLLTSNLCQQGVTDPSLDWMRDLHRSVWLGNTLRVHDLTELLPRFQAAGLPTLVLKGAALAPLYYPHPGLRPMTDVDVLVRVGDVPAAIALLGTMGWTPAAPMHAEHSLPVTHAHPFQGPAGRQLDLHWHVLWECCEPDADDDFWAAAQALSIGGVPTLALGAADQLLHVVVHGAKWNIPSPLRWVADALMILRVHPDLDWDRLVAHSRRRALVLPTRTTLRLLRETLDAPIPTEVLARLERLPVSRLERIEYRAKVRRPGFWGSLPLLACHHARLSRGSRLGSRLLGFPGYLRQAYGLARASQLPQAVGAKLLAHIRERRAAPAS